MNVTKRVRGNVDILDLEGKITIGSYQDLGNGVANSLLEGSRKIILNMLDVTVVDASGIGELVACRSKVVNREGKMKLLNIPPELKEIFEVNQLIIVFEVFEDEDEAVASFSEPVPSRCSNCG